MIITYKFTENTLDSRQFATRLYNSVKKKINRAVMYNIHYVQRIKAES